MRRVIYAAMLIAMVASTLRGDIHGATFFIGLALVVRLGPPKE